MTIKLFEQDAYMYRFTATVLSCEPCENGFAVVLDQTAFFPEGGGQPADKGSLWIDTDSAEAVNVTDVQIDKNGIIIHTVAHPFEVGATVHGNVLSAVRFFRMQNHTAEHLLSGIIHRQHGYDNVGFHMAEDNLVTFDVNGPLSDADIAGLEDEANMAVYANREVYATYPTPEELESIDYRSKLDLTEGVRLITIDGYDVCACCAPHVSRTGEIGLIKILDFVPYKGGTRITMLAGMHAFRDYMTLHDNNREIMRLLSAQRLQTPEFVKRDHDTVAALRAEIRSLSEALAVARLDVVETATAVCGFTKDASFDALRLCAEQHSKEGLLCAMFSESDGGIVNYFLYGGENGDVRDTVKALNTAFSGKGGGKPQYAQGKITATKEQITAFFQ